MSSSVDTRAVFDAIGKVFLSVAWEHPEYNLGLMAHNGELTLVVPKRLQDFFGAEILTELPEADIKWHNSNDLL